MHIPFCRKLCLYCDFYSKIPGNGEIDEFIEAFGAESKLRSDTDYGSLHYDSIFIGGGTPSILEEKQIKAIFDILKLSFNISPKSEVTIECNPSSVDKNKFENYRNSGINRISIGVQSFNDKHLERLGRLHDARTAIESFEQARKSRFDNISIDLIFGIPGQTLKEWENDLKQAIELSPEHISAYNLIIEPETSFGKLHAQGKLELPSEEIQSKMYYLLNAKLSDAGYSRYEISNFAKPGRECHHNLKYWYGRPYLGMGPAAVSFNNRDRIRNLPDLKAYIISAQRSQAPPSEQETLDDHKMFEETIMMRLRLSEGLPLDLIYNQYHFDLLDDKELEIGGLLAEGYITLEDNIIKLTDKALFISDEIILKLL